MESLKSRQQELEVAPAVDGWFLGVDPGANKIGLAWTDGQDRGTQLLALGGAGVPAAQRLHEVFVKAQKAVADIAWSRGDPVAVYVEAVALYGERPSPITYQANGVVQAAVFAGLGGRVTVFEVPVGTWKKEGLGNGTAKKAEVMSWAFELLGYLWHDGEALRLSQDEADALGLAEAARRSVRLGA